MLKVFNVVGVIVLLLLLRKLIWCLRWLWCWKHDRPCGERGMVRALFKPVLACDAQHVQKRDGEG